MSEPWVVNEDRWAAIPEPLLYDPNICAEAVRVYGVLRRHGDDPENCYPSHARIGSFIGKSTRSVPTWIRQLEDAGWVDRVPRKSANGDPDANGYRVYGRAVQRGVRAGERGGVRAEEREGSALHSAPKESQFNESKENENNLFAPDGASVGEGEDLEATRGTGSDYRFKDAWESYPCRFFDDGRPRPKVDRAKALAKWKTLTYEEKSGAFKAIHRMVGAGENHAPDMHRWLARRNWEDWLAPICATANGHGPRPAGYIQQQYAAGSGTQPLPDGMVMLPNGKIRLKDGTVVDDIPEAAYEDES